MADEAGELPRRIKEVLRDRDNDHRAEMETPITPLTPEAREDAQKVARELWTEGMELLGKEDESIRRDLQHNALIIRGKAIIDKTNFKGADLSIERHAFLYNKGVTNSRSELYFFYPDHVLKITRNRSDTGKGGKRLSPRGLTTQKHEANRDELTELLEATTNSTKFIPLAPK